MIDTREARHAAAEVKFVVPDGMGERVREWARRHLSPDPYGAGPCKDTYRTTTLYFDTPDRDVFHQRGSYGRAKYRIRRYGSHDFAFLERKMRRPGLLIKRRTQVGLDALDRLRAAAGGPWPGEWFERRLAARELGPACQLGYQRMARGLETPAGLARLTVDEGLAVAPATEIAFTTVAPVPALEGQMIVEIKFRGLVPAIFKRLIEEFALTPRSASKYRFGVSALTGLQLIDASALEAEGLRA